MGLVTFSLIVAVLAIILALHAHTTERLRIMALTQSELAEALNNATAQLEETRATVDKVAIEQLGLLVKIDELAAALANSSTEIAPEVEAAAAALTAAAAAVKGAVDGVDAQVPDTAPV